MKTIRIRAKLVKIKQNLIFLDFKLVDFGNEICEEDVLGVFGVFVGEKFLYVIFAYLQVVVLIDTIEDKLKNAFVVHETKDGDSWNEEKRYR
jgi:hypothetical protein